MLIWISFAVLTAVVLAALLRPVLRDPQDVLTRDETALAVYKDQLAEIDADLDRGLIQPADADSARAELGRRLLAASSAGQAAGGAASSQLADATVVDGAAATPPPRATPLASDAVIYGAALMVPLLSIGLYLAYGSPGIPARPYADRMAVPAKDATIDELVAKVEAQLRKSPEDGKGWDLIAPVYARQNRFSEASMAYANAMRLLGETPKRLFGFAQARIFENDGLVDGIARKALNRAVELKPDLAQARFWLATAAEQDGDLKGAIAAYQSLKTDDTASPEWQEQLQARIDLLQARVDGTAPALAETLDPAMRDRINQMVAGLAERLEMDPDDLDGWLQLIRSLIVLQRRDEAVKALATAKAEFSDQPAAMQKLASLAANFKMD